ncbi:MAG: WD40 repeat domain-containing protein, partial [Planctomycetota bacterium]
MMKDLLHKYKEKLQSLQAEVEKNPKSPLLWKKLAELHLKVHGLETLEYLEKGILLSRHPEPLLTFKQEILASILHTLGNLSFRHGEKVSKIGFVSQGKILTASYDGKIRMWDISGREVCTFLGHEGPVLSFILTPNEEYLLSASEDKTIRIWDIHQGQELLILRSHEGAVTHLALAGANHFVSASKDGTARVWNLDNGKETLIFERHDSPLTALAVSGDGKLAATAGEDGKILLWVPENGKVGRILDGMTPVGALSFSATKRHLLSGLEDGTLMVWDAALGKAEKKYNIHTQTITEIQLLDKEVVVTCSQDGYAKGINLQDGKETFVIKTPLGGLASFGLHPNGKIAVTGGEEVVVRLWKFPKGGMLSPPMGPTLPIIDLSCCHYLATVSGKDFCQIWNPIKGTLFRTFIWKEMEFHKVALSPSGAKVACGDKKGEIRIWDVGESSLYRSFSEHQAPLTDIKYSPDG